MWLLLLVSGWEVVTSIMVFSGYCFWSAWFALWCNSIFFDLFWNVKFFIAAKLKGFGLYKVPPGSQWKAIFSVSLVCRSKFRRMDCSLNWNFINYGELCCDSFMIAPACETFQTCSWNIKLLPKPVGRIPDSNVFMCGKYHKYVRWT